MGRWLTLAVVAFVLYKLVTNEMRKHTEKRNARTATEDASKAAAGDMVKDPMCGTYVDVDTSISVRDGETVHRFCSYECRDSFLQRLKGEGRAIPENKPPDEDI